MKSELINNNNIIIDKFTYKSSDYYKKDIINNYIKLNNIINPNIIIKIKKKKKKELFDKLCNTINSYKRFNDINVIIKLQSYIRRYLLKIKIKLKGPGIYKPVNNEDDFYYSTNKSEIGFNYYFSYKDDSDNIWMFDIRSIYKLVRDSTKPLNPYTRNIIPDNVIKNIRKIIGYLKKNNIQITLEHENIELDIESKINDIIIKISSYGYNIEKNWIDRLNLYKLKKLYASFQDMWYYRIQLTPETRSMIINDQLFSNNYMFVNTLNDVLQIKTLLFNDVYKLINTTNNNYSSMTAMWCIISFGTVIKKCIDHNLWIQSII